MRMREQGLHPENEQTRDYSKTEEMPKKEAANENKETLESEEDFDERMQKRSKMKKTRGKGRGHDNPPNLDFD